MTIDITQEKKNHMMSILMNPRSWSGIYTQAIAKKCCVVVVVLWRCGGGNVVVVFETRNTGV